jgi:hypothetical protein
VRRVVKASALFVTQSACDPLLSESRYLCTSKIRFVVDPSGFVPMRVAPEPFEMKTAALGIAASVSGWVVNRSI